MIQSLTRAGQRLQRTPPLLKLDAARRLGARPVLWLGWHRLRRASGVAALALRDAAPAAGPFLPVGPVPPAPAEARCPPPPHLPPSAWHGPFDPEAPALELDLFAPGDVRPVWEANRLGWLPALVQAHRRDPRAGHLARAEARLAAWCAANPPYRGPNWACGQEAALRALHLALAHRLLGGGEVPAGMAALARLHARRIAATRAYARAQDNNHGISEPAGLMACALLLGQAARARRAGRSLAAAVARLVAPDGGFAQVSTGYHRLLLDVLAVAEWLRRAGGLPPLPAPFGARAGAATRWLARLACPETGALPRLGHQDGSAFADLSGAGPADARGSVERAARLFLGASAGAAEDPGCAWLGLPAGPALPPEAGWSATGTRGWRQGRARGLLRTGPLPFRPGQADLLHFDLWDGPVNLLRDTGTGAYNPPPGRAWWASHFPSAAAHNLILFDEAEPMPRAGRFLLAGWPATAADPRGGATRDGRGNRHLRRVRVRGREWTVTDEVEGPFARAALRWHLLPGPWQPARDGVEGPAARIEIRADGPLELRLERGWESPAYGQAREVPLLVAGFRRGTRRLETVIRLP